AHEQDAAGTRRIRRTGPVQSQVRARHHGESHPMSTEAARRQRQRGTAGRAEAAWAEAPDAPSTNGLFLCALAAVVMAYGWGYRGIVGHEGGAMVPGALLGLAVCLGSARLDWHRRAAVAGLFGAVGWAWGGSFS